jgi:hypothetical protein
MMRSMKTLLPKLYSEKNLWVGGCVGAVLGGSVAFTKSLSLLNPKDSFLEGVTLSYSAVFVGSISGFAVGYTLPISLPLALPIIISVYLKKSSLPPIKIEK